ncbi:MAG: carboxypeptidase-like regulatory domain-containing protein [Bacteroidales bacterium]|nr:carboxypeptidase-like regulatory domain-containing protein [Bacteroidales bacterium]
MKTKLLMALLLFPVCVFAQERVKVKGHIVNERGEAVEYVQVGVPRWNIGTISTEDGRFEIELPRDTLEFFHVSYQTASYPVTGPADDVVIVLEDQELSAAVFIGGNTKAKYLLRPGTKVAGDQASIAISVWSEGSMGRELGSVAHAKKPFLVKDIMLSIKSNSIPDCVASINIYRIEGKKESFVNVLHKPIYFNIAVSEEPQDFDIQPEETLMLEPGKYFISFQIVGCDEQALKALQAKPERDRKYWEMTLYTVAYFKSSYVREAALGQMKQFPVNIGVAVKGLEFLP